MGNYFLLAAKPARTIRKKKKNKTNYTAGKINIGALLLVALVLMSIFYLIQVNDVSTQGYEIKQLETKLTDLREANKRLELEAASLQSLQSIEGRTQGMNLIPSTKVEYMTSNNEYAIDKR